VPCLRHVVDIGKCGGCHGTFSQGFSIRGNLRNQTEYCVVCHNPAVSDFSSRVKVAGADPNDHLDRELESLVRIANGPDFAAGLEGFLAKRSACFEGR
jgi:Outer membrane cytochrome MtrC/MtrF-like, domains II/IV